MRRKITIFFLNNQKTLMKLFLCRFMAENGRKIVENCYYCSSERGAGFFPARYFMDDNENIIETHP